MENIEKRNERIIKYAADKSGTPYPVDEETREFSESVIRAMDGAVEFIKGNYKKIDIQKYLEDMQRMADEA
jgi:hypothetical protein